MDNSKSLYFETRVQWRKWLEENFTTEKGVWLVYPKKSSGKQRIVYNDAVEEALCFGWIDSTVKTIDADYYIQRFTPRNPKSSYSQPNKERIKWLAQHHMLHPDIQEKLKGIIHETFVFPEDILDILKADSIVWANYQKFSAPYQRIRIAYIDDSRVRPDEFKKRLNNFISKTRDNKLIGGFGGIEKYYIIQ